MIIKALKLVLFFVFLILSSGILKSCLNSKTIVLVTANKNDRIVFGMERLTTSLQDEGYTVKTSDNLNLSSENFQILIGNSADEMINSLEWLSNSDWQKEGYSIQSKDNMLVISGADPSGAMYGCVELADLILKEGALPEHIDITDHPEMVLRGTCIGLQKTEYLPGRTVYEYPYTPDNFPWFYDKEQWIDYLDMMVDNRFNSLYLWNGHPFASLVKLDDYPFAVEVDDETFKLNEEMFGFITEEANKRGIWVIQMFYNIIVSKPFAEHYNIKTQERSRPITPLLSDYTRKSVSAFIEKYPNVGLLVCLGEAMNTIEDDVVWFTETILPGVKDGLESLGKTEEPPVVLRGHDTDAEVVMKAALPVYKNLYTMRKYNGESLTTYEPRNSWATIPMNLSKLGSVHIANVHILANLEPFRYGSPDFIQKSTQAMHDIQGANGLHLYPQASYWDWPYTADKTEPRLKEIDRDWIWYKTWGRYSWNSNRDRNEEIEFWVDVLNEYYDCELCGKDILQAYEEEGEIAPKLLRRFGISDGNRQTLLLGMFMSQLVNPYKWNVYESFLNSNGPEGEILVDYARKEWNGESHIGETPPQIIDEVVSHGNMAVEAIERASPHIKNNTEEFSRLRNDMYCYQAMANFFAEKVKAAEFVLQYKYSNDISDLKQALPFLQKSVEYFKELVELTRDTYLYANSMQTQQRRVPITGRDGTNLTWVEMLPHFTDELENFERNIEMLEQAGGASTGREHDILQPVHVEILNKDMETIDMRKGQKIYSNQKYTITDFAPELKNLKGLQLNDKVQQEEGTTLRFKNEQPVKILVGYFNTNSYTVLRPPTLETNASANDRGQADIKIANAIKFDGLYPVNIYTYKYEAGENELKLGKGRVLILGFIDGDTIIPTHDAGLSDSNDGVPIDWLFY